MFVLDSQGIGLLGSATIAINVFAFLSLSSRDYPFALALFALSAICLAPLSPAVAQMGVVGWIIIALMLVYHVSAICFCAWELLHEEK